MTEQLICDSEAYDTSFKPTYVLIGTKADGSTEHGVFKADSEGQAKAKATELLEQGDEYVQVQVFQALPGKSIAKRITRTEFF